MYTVAEAAEIAKISAVKADEIINAKGIPTENFGGKRFISKENISLLKIKKQKYYKVSVFNEKIFGYVVKKCSLTKSEAEKLIDEYHSKGIEARYSQH